MALLKVPLIAVAAFGGFVALMYAAQRSLHGDLDQYGAMPAVRAFFAEVLP